MYLLDPSFHVTRYQSIFALGEMFEEPLPVLTLDLVQQRWASGDNDLLKEAVILILGPLTLTKGQKLIGFVSSAIEIAQSESLEKETTHLSVDFVITLGEGRHSGYRVLFINKLFRILMSDIETEAASHWAENENDDAGESGNYSVVQKFLNRLAFKLDKYYVVWPMLQDYLASPDGKKRLAAIVALAPTYKVNLIVNKKCSKPKHHKHDLVLSHHLIVTHMNDVYGVSLGGIDLQDPLS
ncbi:importin-5 [Artemisia annua]|uniref:Importin-5 n=1 Tax=Artemisia annua TaxID=35608 RepID=A0A2U1PVD4_ARTAN|nr:importin-5 [Artemisia annua]